MPAILLAAGASSRMGEPKQLVELNGETLLARALRVARQGGASPVLLILGAYFDRICQAIRTDDAMLIHNNQWHSGLATSIQTGLRALDALAPDTAGVMLMSCDQPRLTPAHVAALIRTFKAQEQASIVASAYGGTRGIPAVFPSLCFPELRALKGDKGAHALLLDPPCPLIEIPFEGGEIDIDSPEDLAQFRRR